MHTCTLNSKPCTNIAEQQILFVLMPDKEDRCSALLQAGLGVGGEDLGFTGLGLGLMD